MTNVAPPAGPVGPDSGGLGPAGPIGPPGTGTQGGGFNWNPISWISSTADWTAHQVNQTIIWGGTELVRVAKWGSGVVAGISHAVFHFVHVGLNLLEGMVTRLVGILHRMIASLFVLVHDARSLADGAVNWIHNSAAWFSNQVNHWGGMFMRDVVQPAINAAVKGLHDAGNLAHAAINGLENDWHWVKTVAIPDAEAAAHDANVLAHQALHKAEGFVTIEVFDNLKGQVDSMAGEVTSLANEIPSDLGEILHAVVGAAWFLLKVAEYSPEVVEGLFAAIAGGFQPSELLGKPKDEADITTQVHTVSTKLLGQ